MGFSGTTVMKLKSDSLVCQTANLAHLVKGHILSWNEGFCMSIMRHLVSWNVQLCLAAYRHPRVAGASCALLAVLVQAWRKSPDLRGACFDAVKAWSEGTAPRPWQFFKDRVSSTCVTYPLQIQPVAGRGVVMDEERYETALCPRCQPERIAHLTRRIQGYSCRAHLLRRCPDCSCSPEGSVKMDELEEIEIFLPTKLYVSLSNMRFAKEGYEKRNVHVGWGALCEHTAADPTHEAYAVALPIITRLQNSRAFRLPWLVSALLPYWSYAYFVGPAIPRQACWATRWRETGPDEPEFNEPAVPVVRGEPLALAARDGPVVPVVRNEPLAPVVHTTAARLEVAVATHGGLAGRVAATTPEQIAELGLTGRAAEATVGDTGLDPSSPLLPRSVDGRHAVDVDQLAERIGPVLGNACYYAAKGHSGQANALNGMAERIKDPHASVRKFRYGPSVEQKRTVKRCLNVLTTRWFTKERIQACMMRMGTLEQMMTGKLSEAETSRMVSELLAGVEVSETVDAMVKKEITAKSSKAPRLVMDRGLYRFLIASYTNKIVEELLSELDAECNIKHIAKDERMDILSACMCADALYKDVGQGGLPAQFAKANTLLVENDFSTYEYTQSLEFYTDELGRRWKWSVNGFDEVDMGLLSIERTLIEHVGGLVGTVLNELYPLAEKVLLPETARTDLKPKGHGDKSTFYVPNWRLVLFLRIRCSGDLQTSWGNRVNQFVPWSLAVLGENAPQFWNRLVDMAEGKVDPRAASSWVFLWIRGKLRGRLYWRPVGEGDDHLSQLNTCEPVGADPQSTPSLVRVAKTLEDFGLTHNLVLVNPDGGRAEFVGCHFLGERGCLTKGAWVPDMARGAISSGFTTSDALGNANSETRMRTSLSFRSRASMYKGRCDPMFSYYEQLADEWQLRAGPGAEGVVVKMDWTLASFMGQALGDSITGGAILGKVQGASGPELPAATQIRLAAASLQGAISACEWAAWSTIGVTIDAPSEAVLTILPAAFRARLQKAE